MHARLRTALPTLALTFLAVAGCSKGAKPNDAADKPMGRGGPPPAQVATVRPERRDFGTVLEAVGTALARESVVITSKSANTITAIRFNEGQRVAAGTVLVELDRAQTEAALVEAQAQLAESRNQRNRGRDLSVTQALSRAQLDQLETNVKTAEARVAAARSRLDDTVIRAPFAGTTGLRRVSLGSLVNPGTAITTLDDAASVKLEFTLPQTFLAELATGLPVEARTEGLGDRVFRGKITAIDSRIDPATRSIAGTVRACSTALRRLANQSVAGRTDGPAFGHDGQRHAAIAGSPRDRERVSAARALCRHAHAAAIAAIHAVVRPDRRAEAAFACAGRPLGAHARSGGAPACVRRGRCRRLFDPHRAHAFRR